MAQTHGTPKGRQAVVWSTPQVLGGVEAGRKRRAPGAGVLPQEGQKQQQRRGSGWVVAVDFKEVLDDVQPAEHEFVAAINVRCETGPVARPPKKADVMAHWPQVYMGLCKKVHEHLSEAQKCTPSRLPLHRIAYDLQKSDPHHLVCAMLFPRDDRDYYVMTLGEMKHEWSKQGSPSTVTAHFVAAARLLVHIEMGTIESIGDSSGRQRALARYVERYMRWGRWCVDVEITCEHTKFCESAQKMLTREQAAARAAVAQPARAVPSCAPPARSVGGVVEMDAE